MSNSSKAQQSLFAEDSHASRSACPGTEEARTMTVGSGLRCFDAYGRFSPLTSLSRMFLASSRWVSTRCCLTWRARVSPARRLIFRLQVSTHGTSDDASGLLPTTTAGDAKSSGSRNTIHSNAHAGTSLTDYVRNDGGTGRLLPTPTQPYGHNRGGSMGRVGPIRPSLETMAKNGLIPTPDANSHKTGPRGCGTGAPEQLSNATFGTTTGKLNPRWVEWLMGFPVGWTSSDPSATPSSPSSRSTSES